MGWVQCQILHWRISCKLTQTLRSYCKHWFNPFSCCLTCKGSLRYIQARSHWSDKVDSRRRWTAWCHSQLHLPVLCSNTLGEKTDCRSSHRPGNYRRSSYWQGHAAKLRCAPASRTGRSCWTLCFSLFWRRAMHHWQWAEDRLWMDCSVISNLRHCVSYHRV